MSLARRLTGSRLLAAILAGGFAATTLVWLSLDRLPPNWDDAWYLTGSLKVFDALTRRGLVGYLSGLNSVFGFKAPLIAGLPAPFYLVFGRRWHAAYLVNIAAMLLLFAVLYRMARQWWNARAAVLAIAIAGTLPLLYGLSRWYLAECALTALVALAIAMLSRPEALERRAPALLFGAVCGAGLLLKAAFVLFLLPPFFYIWAWSRQRMRSLLLPALACLAVALPWYAGHWRAVLSNALDAGFGAPAAVQGTGAIFSMGAIATYLGRVAVDGISVFYTVLGLVLVLCAAWRPEMRPPIPRLLIFWLLPFAIFLFGGNKDVRYIAPILPAVALLLAALLDGALPRSPVGTAAAVLVLAFPVASLFAVSFGVPWRMAGTAYARGFNRRPWPLDEILNRIEAETPRQSGQRPLLLVGSDRAGLNANNLELTAVALELPLDIETTAHEPDRNVLTDRLEQAAFFLYAEGGEPESPAFNPHIAALIQQVHGSGGFRELPYSRRLPDGGTAHIFRRLSAATVGEPEAPEEFAVDFGGILTLTSVEMEKLPDSTIVNYSWRRRAPAGAAYWSFTHLIDGSGRILAQLDQPLPLLEPDRAAGQRIRLRLPTGVAASGLRLRFGIYDPPTGSRLVIGPLPAAAASRFTLADRNTALIVPY